MSERTPRVLSAISLALILLVSSVGCGPLPPDDEVIGEFRLHQSSWEQLRELAFEDLHSCREQMSSGLDACPPFNTMAPERHREYAEAAKAVGVPLQRIGFVAMRLDLASGNPQGDICLESVLSESGFPIKLKRKAIVYCEKPVPLRMQAGDLDEYDRSHNRQDATNMFRKIEGGWYVYYTPL